MGPPGTGKSTLGVRLAAQAQRNGWCNEPLTATASADWTTYDTIGGWAQQSSGTLGFREGVVTQALRERRWPGSERPAEAIAEALARLQTS